MKETVCLVNTQKFMYEREFVMNTRQRKIIKSELLKRDGNFCFYCGRSPDYLEIEHKVPQCRGGSDDLSNLVLACYFCNNHKATKTADEWLSWMSFYPAWILLALPFPHIWTDEHRELAERFGYMEQARAAGWEI
jgi:CRISPR/Cas system Type II protein with McrA/HNH and RuvC-like nuclease domain